MAFSSDLERLLARWLPRQRWFPQLGGPAGQEPDLTPLSVVRLADVPEAEGGTVRVAMAVVGVGSGERSARIALPLTFRTREALALREHRVGETDDLLLGPVGVYDGAADPVGVQTLMELIRSRAALPGAHLSGHLAGEELGGAPEAEAFSPDPDRLAAAAAELRVRIGTSRGQETRTVVDAPDGSFVLTLVRTLSDRRPPAVRVPLALTAVGSRTVHPVVGWAQARWFDAEDSATLSAPYALLAHALPDSHPVWRDAVRLAMRVDSGSVGSFNRQASSLGTVVGELHGDLAGEFGLVQSGGEPTARLVGRWRRRVDWALRVAGGPLAGLEEQLREHARALEELTTVGPLQRIHGELTLENILTGTAEGPRVISFSADPADEPRPAAFDLVALLRSIDYAAGFSWLRGSGALERRSAELRRIAGEGLFGGAEGSGAAGAAAEGSLLDDYLTAPERLWCGQATNSLLSGYSHAAGATASLRDPVLRAALVDRLLVEIATEKRNRPSWVIVPLAALSTLLGGRESADTAGEASVAGVAADVSAGAAAVETDAGEVEAEPGAGIGVPAADSVTGEAGKQAGTAGATPVVAPQTSAPASEALTADETSEEEEAAVPTPPAENGRSAEEPLRNPKAADASQTDAFGLPREGAAEAVSGPVTVNERADLMVSDGGRGGAHAGASSQGSGTPRGTVSGLSLPTLVDMPAAGSPPTLTAPLPTAAAEKAEPGASDGMEAAEDVHESAAAVGAGADAGEESPEGADAPASAAEPSVAVDPEEADDHEVRGQHGRFRAPAAFQVPEELLRPAGSRSRTGAGRRGGAASRAGGEAAESPDSAADHDAVVPADAVESVDAAEAVDAAAAPEAGEVTAPGEGETPDDSEALFEREASEAEDLPEEDGGRDGASDDDQDDIRDEDDEGFDALDDEDEDLAGEDVEEGDAAPRPKPVNARRWSKDDFLF
ncbi:maltokinase N-terminal cap-like domain-containing protein [Brevibacterium album]|uniref:maltokinase N-terminal cap-like domain-containing protein n=1 Tax=Brevibacterium album TaxID=417948 RepID=UPI0012EC36E2|nr:hypothetical protein [Brevibacterium album]